jgi:hypothetical protein
MGGGMPLRVSQRLANNIMWEIWSSSMSCEQWVEKIPFKGKGEKREAATLARAIDLMVMESGVRYVEESAACEVLLRRLFAIRTAAISGTWKVASFIEELPGEKDIGLHEVVVKDLLATVTLADKAIKGGAPDTP